MCNRFYTSEHLNEHLYNTDIYRYTHMYVYTLTYYTNFIHTQIYNKQAFTQAYVSVSKQA